MQLSKKRKIAVLAVIAITVLIIVWQQYRNTKKNGFLTEPVKRSTITESVTETGVIVAAGQTDIYSPTNGLVTDIFVDNGASVSAGQKLFAVKSTATEQERQAASANYLTAQSALNTAEATANTLRSSMYSAWDTFYDLATNSTYENADDTPNLTHREAAEFQTTQDDWLAAEKKYKNQETAIGAARAQVTSAWQLYQATQNAVVTSQTAGTVANLAVSAGDSVAAGPNVTLGLAPILTIANITAVEMKVPLGQSDIANVKPGQTVSIEPDAYKDGTYTGNVLRVDSIGTNVSGVVKYNVYIGVTNADEKLKSGMTGDATITTTVLENVLSVPNAAVKLYNGERAVRVIAKGKKEPEYIPVKVGIKGSERTQVVSGIDEGRDVIVSLTNEQIKRSGFFGF